LAIEKKILFKQENAKVPDVADPMWQSLKVGLEAGCQTMNLAELSFQSFFYRARVILFSTHSVKYLWMSE
jgi:hypothetical protein